MNDQELSSFGAQLYRALLGARLSEPHVRQLADALRSRTPWAALPNSTKLSVLMVAAGFESAPRTELSSSHELDSAALGFDAPPAAVDDDAVEPAPAEHPRPSAAIDSEHVDSRAADSDAPIVGDDASAPADASTAAAAHDRAPAEAEAVNAALGPPTPAEIEALVPEHEADVEDPPRGRRRSSR